MSEQQTYGPDSWQARGAHIAELERQAAEDRAAIRDSTIAIREFATAKGAMWFHNHAAAIARADQAEEAR